MTASTRHEALVDTSVAVALSVQDHASHDRVSAELTGYTLGLSGHAAFETFSVLTRLPAPLRRDAPTVQRLLDTNFPATRFLSETATANLFPRLAGLGISGGSVYDALVAAAAVAADAVLYTRDKRALRTYHSLDAQVQFIQ